MRTGRIGDDRSRRGAHDTTDKRTANVVGSDTADDRAARGTNGRAFRHAGIAGIGASTERQGNSNKNKHRFHGIGLFDLVDKGSVSKLPLPAAASAMRQQPPGGDDAFRIASCILKIEDFEMSDIQR
jgi:hypothetical protein